VAGHADLLKRFQPQLRYDSQEAFFADSAAEWTDNPGNELRRAYDDGREGELLAATDSESGQAKLSLDFLGHPTYADGTTARDDDRSAPPRATTAVATSSFASVRATRT